LDLTAPLTFEMLQQRLLAATRRRLSNGEFTERGLARLVGVSQPHVHHILKGSRMLTPEIGDSLLATLDLSLFDLLTDDELGHSLADRHTLDSTARHLPILAGRLGPQDPFPDWRAVARWIRPGTNCWSRAARPALVEYAPDPELPASWRHGAWALLDGDDAARARPALPCWYALRWRGAGFLRQLRREKDALVILSQGAFAAAALPARIELSEASVLHVVRGRLLWWGDDARGPGDGAHPAGEWLPDPAASS
jgi:hypothetical protein